MISIIVPVYNEYQTIRELVKKVEETTFNRDITKEIIIVDDGSTDGTREILNHEISTRHKVVFHDQNQGKGSSIRSGLAVANGDYFVIQDADLEYDPQDLPKMLDSLQHESYEVIYGSRVLGKKHKRYSSFFFHLGGLLVTWWTNFLYRTHLTDEATCYKMFSRKVLNSINLQCKRFEFCPEFTGKVLRAGYQIHEIPISYHPRSKKEGKKINTKDGLQALWTLFKIRFQRHI